MRQGTTPTHTFTLPFDTNIVSKVRVIYAQGEIVKVVKRENEVQMEGNTITVTLTQADTLRLNHRLRTEIQIRVLTHSEDAFASDIIEVRTDRCLTEEVL